MVLHILPDELSARNAQVPGGFSSHGFARWTITAAAIVSRPSAANLASLALRSNTVKRPIRSRDLLVRGRPGPY